MATIHAKGTTGSDQPVQLIHSDKGWYVRMQKSNYCQGRDVLSWCVYDIVKAVRSTGLKSDGTYVAGTQARYYGTEEEARAVFNRKAKNK